MTRRYCPTRGCTRLPQRDAHPYCDVCAETDPALSWRAWFDRVTRGWARVTVKRERGMLDGVPAE